MDEASIGANVRLLCLKDGLVGGQPHEAGRLKALAVSAPRRMDRFPNAATTEEQGFPEKASFWQGIFPPLANATSESPAAFAQFVAAETQSWAKVIKEAGSTPH